MISLLSLRDLLGPRLTFTFVALFVDLVKQANLIKESIRMGHTFLGEFFYEKGDLNAALKCYIRTRDYCTTSKHIITMCLNVIK